MPPSNTVCSALAPRLHSRLEARNSVPMVELETVNFLRYVTDSNGLAALTEPLPRTLVGEPVRTKL